MKKSFITEKMAVSRISECVEITDLSEEFRLSRNTPFSLYIRPKTATDETSVLISAEPYAGNGFRDIPFTLNNWNEYYLSAIAANGIDLSNYRVWWGTGGAATVAEAPPTPPAPTTGTPFTEVAVGTNLRGKLLRFDRQDLPMSEFPLNPEDPYTSMLGLWCDEYALTGIMGYTEGVSTAVGLVKNGDFAMLFYTNSDNKGWFGTLFLMPDDQDYIITKNTTKPSESGFWGFQYAYVLDAPLPAQPKLTELPMGYNLRGKTIEFTNTDKYVPNPGVGEKFVQALAINGFFPGDADAFLALHGVSFALWQIGFEGSSGSGIEAVNIFGINQDTGEQTWLTTSITIPNDKDYIVGTNMLKPHEGDNWGFDYAIVR